MWLFITASTFFSRSSSRKSSSMPCMRKFARRVYCCNSSSSNSNVDTFLSNSAMCSSLSASCADSLAFVRSILFTSSRGYKASLNFFRIVSSFSSDIICITIRLSSLSSASADIFRGCFGGMIRGDCGAHVDNWDNVTPAAVFSIQKFVPLDEASTDYITAALQRTGQ